MIFTTLIIFVVFITIYYWSFYNSKKDCKIDTFDIDNIHIIKRDPYYERYINKLIDEKSYLFNEDELRTMKNKFQFYKVDNDNIENISKDILQDCKNNKEYFESMDDIYDNPQYNKIINEFNKDINTFNEIDCNNSSFLDTKKLNNYYYDIFGNRINSTTKDYMSNYYSTINNNNNNYCIPVKIIKGSNEFIIPDQYNNEKYSTNAYNIDYSRIINPLTVY